jgi:Ricin-type beta-trefoil lectin domain
MKRVLILFLATIGVTTGLVTPARADYFSLFHGVPLVVSNPATNRVIDVASGQRTPEAVIRTWPFIGWSAQNWKFFTTGGYFYAVAQHSGQCLDVQWGSHDPSVPVWQWPCNRGDAQLWWVEQLGTDRFGATTARLRNKGSDLCLTMPDLDNPHGAQLQQHPCDGNPAQQWQFTHPVVNPGTSAVLTSGAVRELTNIVSRSFDGSPNQNFQPVDAHVQDTDGAAGFRFNGGAAGGCMLPSRFSTLPFPGAVVPGTRITTATCAGNSREIWFIRQLRLDQLGAPMWQVQHADSRLCLDLAAGGLPANQSYLQLWPCHGGWNQLWHF